jgi:flagellar basal-body rod modification protein FlgD
MALEIVDVPVSGVNGPRRVPKQQLGKDDFLLLLTKQLQNQDPLQPADNLQFISQMANFSTLEQMTNMTKTLEKFLAATTSSYKAEAMSYLGMKVTATPNGSPDSVTGLVRAVRFADGAAILRVGDREVKLEEIQKIEFPDAT